MGDEVTPRVARTEEGPYGRYKRIGYEIEGHVPVTGVLHEISATIETSFSDEEDYPHHVLVSKDGVSGQWRAWIRRSGKPPKGEES